MWDSQGEQPFDRNGSQIGYRVQDRHLVGEKREEEKIREERKGESRGRLEERAKQKRKRVPKFVWFKN